MNIRRTLLGAAAGIIVTGSVQVQAIPIATELMLLADVSGSLDTTDFNLQRDGYEAAFRNANVINAIESVGGIAVSLAYWSESAQTAVGWTTLTDSASSNAFADLIAAAARPNNVGNGTGMANAMNFGANEIANNGYEGSNVVVDVSGDGADSIACSSTANCAAVQTARDFLLNSGVDRVNALWIEDEAQPSSRKFFCLDASCNINPLDYGSTNVIGGTGSFQQVASNFDDFSDAIASKIEREIVPQVPLPSTVLLFGLGLAGLGWTSRRKQRS